MVREWRARGGMYGKPNLTLLVYWDCFLLFQTVGISLGELMPTAHHMTRQGNSRQENRVMCRGLRHTTIRQKSGLVLSDLTMLDICNKARFLSCHVVDPRTLQDLPVRSCLVMSRCVMWCNVRWALEAEYRKSESVHLHLHILTIANPIPD